MAQEYPQETAIIKVGEVDKYKVGEYAHFKDASGKAWNAGSELADYLPNPKATGVRVTFAEGNKLKVGFEMHDGVDGRRPSRWVKRVRFANDDETLSQGYEPKPAWTPGGGGNGGFKSNGEFRTPEQIMRGQALEAAVAFTEFYKGDNSVLDTAKQFYAYILGDFEAKVAEVAEGLDATVENDSFPPDDF